ncbi:MAG: YigZ family protein [Bacilli bacterium]
MVLLNNFIYEEKRSKFLIYLYEVSSTEDLKTALNHIKEENKKAKHVLRVGRFQNNFEVYITEASEDKEPISSMKKIAQLMEKKDIRDKAVIIVRYFGGVMFGASYLDKVYTDLALKALGLR